MPKHIIWSSRSEEDLENILIYLQKEWNEQVVLVFLYKVENILLQISTNPKQFPLQNKRNKVRKCVVSKQNTIFYRENKKSIEILRIFDTRQDPKKLNYGK